MIYFANSNAITEQDMTDQLGWIEIDATQHQAAFDALLAGREVAILDGVMTVRDKRPSEHHEWEDGEWVDKIPEPEPLTQEQIIEGFRLAIQAHVDAVATAKLYDNGTSLASYVASTDPQWAAEAAAFVAWRDAVWTYVYAELDKVMSGEREQPTVEQFVAELPEIEWPV